jgi:hypothetical protein
MSFRRQIESPVSGPLAQTRHCEPVSPHRATTKQVSRTLCFSFAMVLFGSPAFAAFPGCDAADWSSAIEIDANYQVNGTPFTVRADVCRGADDGRVWGFMRYLRDEGVRQRLFAHPACVAEVDGARMHVLAGPLVGPAAGGRWMVWSVSKADRQLRVQLKPEAEARADCVGTKPTQITPGRFVAGRIAFDLPTR